MPAAPTGQRIQEHRRVAREDDVGQQHRGRRRHAVGLEQVGRHARAVADVVADVVRDHGRIARIVLGDVGLDLADQVGADVGALGEDAAAQAREDGDQRAAEGESDQRVGLLVALRVHHGDDRREREQAQADHHQARHRAALEGQREGLAEAVARRLRDAHVRAHRDVHADEAGGRARQRAEHEAARVPPVRGRSRSGAGSARPPARPSGTGARGTPRRRRGSPPRSRWRLRRRRRRREHPAIEHEARDDGEQRGDEGGGKRGHWVLQGRGSRAARRSRGWKPARAGLPTRGGVRNPAHGRPEN